MRALRARNLEGIQLGGSGGNGVTARRFREAEKGAGDQGGEVEY